MAYDPYKSLLANATREHLKRSADLNTHLVGNVFLPAIDSNHKKKPSATSTASLKHLKVIEQCIMAENKREERLAKCATIKERRIMTKKFQTQRERERELIQALMLGNYPEKQEVKLLEADVAAPMTPRQQFNQETTGLSAKVAKPDRVFRKADVTGGVPKAKPHAHTKFKLPQCNGSPGRKADTRAQAAASAKLSSPPRKAPPSSREADAEIARKKRSPSRSAASGSSVASPKKQVKSVRIPSATAPIPSNQRAQSPYISPQRIQSRATRTTPQLSSLSAKPAEEGNPTDVVRSKAEADASNVTQELDNSSVSFEGALSFSEAQRVAMGSDVSAQKSRCEQLFAEIATQTTPRLVEKEDGIRKASSRPELPPLDPPGLVGAQHQDPAATTPRRPQSVRVIRSTRQAFLESLAKESKHTREREEATAQHPGSSDKEMVDAASGTVVDKPCSVAVELDAHAGEEVSTEAEQNGCDGANVDNIEAQAPEVEEEYSEDEDLSPDGADSDEDLETDVAEILFDLIDLVEEAAAEEERQKALPSPRTVSPRPRSSVGRTTKYVLRIQSLFRGYRARIAFRLALYEDALSCGVLGAMPGTIQGRSGWYLDPKRLMAYYFVIPDPDGEWEQKFTLRCSRLVLTPYEMQQEVLSKAPAMLQQREQQENE